MTKGCTTQILAIIAGSTMLGACATTVSGKCTYDPVTGHTTCCYDYTPANPPAPPPAPAERG